MIKYPNRHMPLLEITTHRSKEGVTLDLRGSLTGTTISKMAPIVSNLVSDPTLKKVVLNLDELIDIDSSGLAQLLSFHRILNESDIRFRLMNVHGEMLRLFQVSNLHTLFDVDDSEQVEGEEKQDNREALWQSHAFTTQLIAAVAEAVIGIGKSGVVQFLNPAAEKLLGMTEKELVGNHFGRYFTLVDPEGTVHEFNGFHHTQQIKEKSSPVSYLEGHLVRPDGTRTEVEVICTTVYHGDEKLGGLIGFRDMTETRRNQEELIRLATAVHQAAEMIMITDPMGVIQYVNPAFEKVTGYSRGEVIGKNSSILRSGKHSTDFYRRMWETINEGEVWIGRFTNRRKDGSLYEEECTISPVQDAMGHLMNFVAVKRDITQEVTLEKQLRESQKLEAIARLAGGIAHDFNNLLTTILGNIGLAQKRSGSDIKDFLARAEKACLRGAQLVQQLLLYSRESQVEAIPLSLNTVVTEVVELARQTIDRRIDLKMTLDSRLPIILADPGQMHQVLLNLVVNARDAIEEVMQSVDMAGQARGFSIHVQTGSIQLKSGDPILPHNFTPGDYVILTVSDDGCGMDLETRQKLFEPFFSTKAVGKGTGLGLATVYGIVNNHQGWVHVQSEPNKGSSFSVYLPIAQVRELPQPPRIERTPVVGGTERILVVDDEEPICEIVKTALETQGYQVLTALDGEQGLAIYRKERHRIDGVILDLSMPRLSGREVLMEIRKQDPDACVLISSGYLGTESGDEAFQGCFFVQKPYVLEDLIAKVREALDSIPYKRKPE